MSASLPDDPKGWSDKMLPIIYDELKGLAMAQLAKERPGHTLQPTALVHEAWLRLSSGNPAWNSRGHFFCAAANAMRRILVESARRKGRLKRGSNSERIELDQIDLPVPMRGEELLALDEALDDLARLNPEAVEVVKLRFFVGLTQEQIANELVISVSSVERLWAFSRAWLFHKLRNENHKPN